LSFLPEYAVLPEVLEATGEPSIRQLRSLTEMFLRDGLVRNLYSGQWRQELVQKMAALSPVACKVLKHLIDDGRLISSRKRSPSRPQSSEEWCREALESHKQHRALRAVFAERSTAVKFAEEPLVLATDDPFERGDIRPDNSAELRFHVDDYREYLGPLIKVAREICFIDPYINPDHAHYRHEFLEVLKLATENPNSAPIQIHRMSEYEPRRGNQPAKELCTELAWRPIFADWNRQLAVWKLKVDVHIWGKFGSRYFLTNHVGLSAGKGFKSDPTKKERHHWSMLTGQDRKNLRLHFNPLGQSPTYTHLCHFSIGAV